MKNEIAVLAAALTLAVAGAACENTAAGMKKDAEQNRPAAERAAESAGEKAREVGQDIGDAARAAAAKAKEGLQDAKDKAREEKPEAERKASDVGTKADGAKQHLDVKAALAADASVDGSHVDIDTNAGTRTLMLRGTVPSAAQKTKAGEIARAHADGWTVKNELAVAAR